MGTMKGGLNEEPNDPQITLDKAFEQVIIWRNRAQMAWEQRNDNLTKRALAKVWKYQTVAAELQGLPAPEEAPDPLSLFGSPGSDELQKCKDQIVTWRNRAAMAWKMRNDAVQRKMESHGRADLTDEAIEEMESLTSQALTRMWEYQVIEARLEGREPPQPPSEPGKYFGEWSDGPGGGPRWGPLDPSRVPRKPLPSAGSASVALPLPNEEKNES